MPPPPRIPGDEHPPGPAALYEPLDVPASVPAPTPGPAPVPTPAPVPVMPPAAPTGWTLTDMPAVGAPGPAPVQAPAPAPSFATPLPFSVPGVGGGLGAAPRGRILVVEGGYGSAGRRTWGRGVPAQATVLSAMLAAVSPQVLLAADAVDAVHLPGASDPHTVLAHLRAAARHPGPLLVHLGGHLVADKRGGQLHLTLRDSKAASIRQDGLPWQAIAAELSHRPADWQTLVIADLSADQNAWPLLQTGGPGAAAPLSDGVPLWAVVSPDPEQIGTFTRALIEALHGGRPGAGEVLAPEQLRQQVYSVLRPDVVIVATHAPDRPVFRNTARRTDGPVADALPMGAAPVEVVPVDVVPTGVAPVEAVPAQPVVPVPAAASEAEAVEAEVVEPDFIEPDFIEPEAGEPEAFVSDAVATAVVEEEPAPEASVDGLVSLRKAGVPPTPRPPARPVTLQKQLPDVPRTMTLRALMLTDVDVDVDVETDAEAVAVADVDTEDVAVEDVTPTRTPTPTPTSGVRLAKAASPVPYAAPAVDEPQDAVVEPEPEGVVVPAPDLEEELQSEAEVPLEEPRFEEDVPVEEPPLLDEPAPLEEAPGPEAQAEPEAQPEPGTSDESGTSDEPADPAAAEDPASAGPEPRADYRETLGRIVRSADAGDHAAATDLAFALELEAIAEHGAVSEPVLQVRQVRAHVCRLAGKPAEAADIYREVALTLLRSQGADHPETQQAATNAEACWRAIKDRTEAIRIAPEIIELRAYLPGPEGRKLRAAERYLAQLAAPGN
ncbi:hypothetical protein ACFV4G_08620 [Kitasatospora sp. NPDC059747]|uniref:hypothetical protein n=1 Tax=Kitasatospora sp. NPDC059747 TaxID=3346930 RepID=UPI0036537E83